MFQVCEYKMKTQMTLGYLCFSLIILGCEIKKISARAFQNIKQLERLYLHNNKIEEVMDSLLIFLLIVNSRKKQQKNFLFELYNDKSILNGFCSISAN